MKIYVAGASAERAVVGRYIAKLREAGAEITFDWVAPIEADGGVANEGLSPERSQELAQAALDGVEAAEVVWILVPKTASIGAWIEMGSALTLRRRRALSSDGTSGLPRIFVSGAYQRTIFSSLTCEVYDRDEDAYSAIVEMVQR